MSLMVSLGAALSGLQVNQKAIEVASHNVANAHTAGYSRQTLNREAVALNGQGGGVRASSIGRSVDEFLLQEKRQQTAALGAAAVQDSFLQRMQDLFGSPGSAGSLPARLADLATRIDAVAIDPESPTRRLDMVEAAKAFARDLNAMSDSIQEMRTQADADIAAAVDEVNAQLATIADLNARIARETALGREAGDLLDARDRAVDKVAELIDVRYYVRSTGEAVLYTAAGQPLVDRTVQTLEYRAAGATMAFGDVTVGGQAITDDIRSGRIRALLDMRDNTLPDFQAQLDALAEKARDQVNLAHNRASAVPAPNALAGRRQFTDVAAEQITLSAPVRVAVVDARGVIQRHADIPAGAYTIGGIRDAINAALGGAATASVADGAGLSIAAADPAQGIAIVDLAGAGLDATVTHTAGGATRQYQGFSAFFGLNDLFVTADAAATGTAATIAVRSDIAADPGRLARARLNDVGAPAAGTTIGLTAGDNRGLLGLAAVFDATLSFRAAGGLAPMTGSLGDYATQILSNNAVQAANATDRFEYQRSVADDIAHRAAATSGVNIDEEMANLVVYQNAYAASARLISVVSEMLETLTSLR